MSIERKRALKRLAGLSPQVEEHLTKIAADPANPSAPHWTKEVEDWLTQMEEAVTHVGKKTGAGWAQTISAWRGRIGE